MLVVVVTFVRVANVIVVGVLYLSVCLVEGMLVLVVLVVVRWLGIFGNGGIMVVMVVMTAVVKMAVVIRSKLFIIYLVVAFVM